MAEKICDRVDVAQLECHFKWFKELNTAFGGQWLLDLLSKKLHNDLMNNVAGVDDTENTDATDNRHDLTFELENHKTTLNSHRLAIISWRFTLILRNTFDKHFAEALQMSHELLNLEEVKNPLQPQVHVDTFTYIVLANQLNILNEWRLCADCTVDENEVVQIATRIESLKVIVESNEAKAFVNAMKSNLARDMQDIQLRVDFAKMATELTPQCECWHQTLYLALRSKRRNTDFRQKPSQLEIDACLKAYELGSTEPAGNISIANTVQMAKLYGELLFTCRRGSEEHQELTERAIKFAREAVRLKPNSKTCKMRLVTLLTSYKIYRRYLNEGYDEAQKIVRECEVGQCDSTTCHQLGKFYSHRNIVGSSSAKALGWFEKGLEAHIGNFPCFADMLRNDEFLRKSSSEIVQKIDNILGFQSKRTFKCQLNFIKGFFQWTDDPDATVFSWLMAIEESTDLNINFVELASRNFCYLKKRNEHEALGMMQSVKLFMSRQQMADSDDPIFIQLKNVVNSIIERFEQKSRMEHGNPIASSHVQQRNWRN